MRKLSLLLPLVFACSSNNTDKPVAAAPAPQHDTLAKASADPAAKSCAVDNDCSGSQLCIKNSCVDISQAMNACVDLRVHFELDQATIAESERPALERLARCLTGDRQMKVTIEGNADERGTSEYNLSLGQRRASAVETYLTRLGATNDRIKAISYGKEKPVCTEHNEDCWAQNRRAAVDAR